MIWTCDTAPGTVILRESGNLETKIPVPESGTFHAVPLEGLLPDTEYSYQVVSGDRLSSEHIFRTLPERRPDGTSAPFPFIAYGDNRSKPDRHEEVIDSILKGPAPSLVVSTGDLVYSGSDRKRWFREFLDPAEALFARVPIMLSLGNHDLDLDAPKPRPLAPFWLENFAFPGHLDDPGYGRWFSLDAGGVHFLILDSTSEKNEDQMRWLREDLSSAESRGADFRIAVFHHPPYAAGGHDSSLSLRRIWEPLFVEHGVDLVFNGHNHYYQRSWPVVGGEVQARAMHQEGSDIIQAGQAPVYVVTGGGGAPLYDPKEKDFVAVSAKSHHHVLVQYVPGALNCRAIDTNGVILDEFTLINGE
ncbi:MAG: metallophosphoesterase family protein [Gemmatimonadales bacterium]|nr:metallophosphoesterase family protein [Gemmatimonadales bacterium]